VKYLYVATYLELVPRRWGSHYLQIDICWVLLWDR